MFHSRKKFNYNSRIPWTKKRGNSFDTTMGACGGVETVNSLP